MKVSRRSAWCEWCRCRYVDVESRDWKGLEIGRRRGEGEWVPSWGNPYRKLDRRCSGVRALRYSPVFVVLLLFYHVRKEAALNASLNRFVRCKNRCNLLASSGCSHRPPACICSFSNSLDNKDYTKIYI